MVAIEDTDNAFYFNIEQQLTRNVSGGGLRIFASMIHADKSISAIGEVLAFGGYIDAPLVSRPNDRIGFAVGRNSVSNDLNDAQRFYNANFSNNELSILPLTVFNKTRHLRKLLLQNNSLTAFPSSQFEGLINLRHLNML